MPRRLVVNHQAHCDLGRIARFIGRTASSGAATRWRSGIEKVIRSLTDDAEIWPEADEAATFGVNLRFRMFGKKRWGVYRILYTYDDAAVTIHRVMHSSQDWLAELD